MFIKNLRFFIILLTFASALSLSSGCSSVPQAKSVELFAMDTVMHLTAYGPQAESALGSAASELDRLDAALSVTRQDSSLAVLNASGGGSLSPELAQLLPQALEISRMTGGAFDPTLLPLSQAWGFYGDAPAIPEPAQLSAALALCGYEKLALEQDTLQFGQPNMGLDLGGIAKGYAAGQLSSLLKAQGVTSAVLSLGGNVQTVGTKPDGSLWQIAVQDPFDSNAYAGILRCGECAVVTSGAYQRYFEENGRRYHHILDRETGYPAESGLASVTIVCADPVLADGFSTALFVMGLAEASAFWQENSSSFQAILITSSGDIFVTAGLADSFSAPSGFEVIAS